VSSGGIGPKSPLRVMDRQISVLRGETVDEYGDVSDVGTPVFTGVPAAIAEVSQTAFDPATQRPQIIRSIQGVMPGWAEVRTTDTLYEPATDRYFMIEDVSQEPGFGLYPPRQLLTLRVRSGVTVESEESP
jgi:hypothetical protein